MPALPNIDPVGPQVLTSTDINRLLTALAFEFNRPRAQIRQTSAQSVSSGIGGTALVFDTVDQDANVAGAAQWASGQPTRLTAVYPGKYLLFGATSCATNAAGSRGAYWSVNGVVLNGGSVIITPASGQPNITVARAFPWYFDLGDYVELITAQTSGGALNTAVSGGQQSTMGWLWIASS